jgi:hypothetical protein
MESSSSKQKLSNGSSYLIKILIYKGFMSQLDVFFVLGIGLLNRKVEVRFLPGYYGTRISQLLGLFDPSVTSASFFSQNNALPIWGFSS